MQMNQILKLCGTCCALFIVQACASAPDAKSQKPDGHIKTEVPPPFPITPESLRQEREKEQEKEREAAARKKTAQ